jgi:CheY-like chemotaxis protein
MDHMMPEMDGIEAMRRIKADHQIGSSINKDVLFVALTANAVSSARNMFLSEGFDGFVAKPIDLPELERVMRSVLPKNAISFEDTPRVRVKPGDNDKKPSPASVPDKQEDVYAPLRAAGVDIRQGLHYCQDDEEFYRTLLQFAAEAQQKRAELEQFSAASDLPAYAIRIHALKSTAKMIGANALSEQARALEEASKDGRAEEVAAGHPAAMAAYDALISAIFAAFGAPAETADTGAPADEDVLEFSPEEDCR